MYVRCVLYSKNNLNKLTEEWYVLKQNDYYGIKKKHLSFHRKNGPSILYENGGEVWYLDGNLHREFGLPALTLQKNKEFFLRGKQYEIEEENLGDALHYLKDGMECEAVFYDGKAISVELPTTIARQIIYSEPAVKGNTSGNVLKEAKIENAIEANCHIVQVPLFVRQDAIIDIDIRTNEYKVFVRN